MSDTFITADEHYGHENIIEYCNRPFANVDEMREALIARHNAKVPDSKNALTIHVGDMFWRTLSSKDVHGILDRLHGRHAYVWDIGVDSHNFEPWSLEEIAAKMVTKISNHVITPDKLWLGKEIPEQEG
jgi:calcineurin-like phosphoesterase family protein